MRSLALEAAVADHQRESVTGRALRQWKATMLAVEPSFSLRQPHLQNCHLADEEEPATVAVSEL